MKRIFVFMLCLCLLICAGCQNDVQEQVSSPPSASSVEGTTILSTDEEADAVIPSNAAETESTENSTATEMTEQEDAASQTSTEDQPLPETESEPVPDAPPTPQTVAIQAAADHTVLLLTTLSRGDTVEIVGEYDAEHYVVTLPEGYGLIEKGLVRLEGEPKYESWDGYARSGAVLYNNYHLFEDGSEKLNRNTSVTVIDSLGHCLVVQVDEQIGYMLESQISRSYIRYTAPAGSADGGDISLACGGGTVMLSAFVESGGDTVGQAAVLANDAEVILGWFDRGDTIDMITEEGFLAEKDGWLPVYALGLCGYVRNYLAIDPNAEPYAPWNGFARNSAGFYNNYYLNGDPVSKLSTNTQVCVLYDLGNCYLVSVGEDTGYMDKEEVSTTKIVYRGGGSGGAEWTEPVL